MDLFCDLPPPRSNAKNGVPSLFEQLPRASDAKATKRSASQEAEDGAVKKSRAGQPQRVLWGYVGERRGEREEMQDAHSIHNDLTPLFTNLPPGICRVAYYGVFDGHSGARASKHAAETLHHTVISKFPTGIQNLNKEIKKCLIDSFKKTDENFLVEASKNKPSWKDGSTAVILLVVDDVIYSANLGDSKAILCRREEGRIKCIPLSKDHTPANFEERKRIESAGGMVRDGRVMGIVEVSRSIGDGRFKHCGVIAVPDIFRCQITDQDQFALLACDGLWNAFSAQEAVEFVIGILENEDLKPPQDISDTNYESVQPKSVREFRCHEACTGLAVEAVMRGCTDNVTVLLVDIDQTPPTI